MVWVTWGSLSSAVKLSANSPSFSLPPDAQGPSRNEWAVVSRKDSPSASGDTGKDRACCWV